MSQPKLILSWICLSMISMSIHAAKTAYPEDFPNELTAPKPMWYDHDEECFNLIGNRDLYEVVSAVCNDCQNVFRESNIEHQCRRNCFWNKEFKICMSALRLSYSKRIFRLIINILRVGPSQQLQTIE